MGLTLTALGFSLGVGAAPGIMGFLSPLGDLVVTSDIVIHPIE
jgi:hypothetical protein